MSNLQLRQTQLIFGHKYKCNVYWSDEDDAFMALVPAFPGLSALGYTIGRAIEEAELILPDFIELSKLVDADGMVDPDSNG